MRCAVTLILPALLLLWPPASASASVVIHTGDAAERFACPLRSASQINFLWCVPVAAQVAALPTEVPQARPQPIVFANVQCVMLLGRGYVAAQTVAGSRVTPAIEFHHNQSFVGAYVASTAR